jgi:uncharacterized protein (DUF1778 family)
MPRRALENSRISLRIHPRDKATILRGSALAHTDMTDFIVRTAVLAAQDLIDKAERVMLSERDSLRVLNLLEHPPVPNAKLIAAAQALPVLK